MNSAKDKEKKGQEPPHYLGHRARLRDKFIKAPDSIADYEVLELLLAYGIPRKDVKPLAKDLLARFGGFAGVLSADTEELVQVKGLKEATAVYLRLIREANVRALKSKIVRKNILANWDSLIDFCKALIGGSKIEAMQLIWINAQMEVMATEEHRKGTVNAMAIYPDEIARKALSIRASHLVMLHNHPTGSLKPSRDDIDTTNDVKTALFAIGINLFDHLIMSADGYYSFRDKGMII